MTTQIQKHEDSVVATIPSCDFCKISSRTPAFADAALPNGSWAYVCIDHFVGFNCELGLGKGQILLP